MQVTDILSAALVGVLVGVLGRLVLPGRQRIGVFVTFLIGIGAALLGSYVANLTGLDDNAPAQLAGVEWDWIELAIQVGFAAIGTALAAAIAHTRIAHNETPLRRKSNARKSR
jgi:uncharacterized membrane protein YeaQ/YmgE (transglycosylase-associated protein family)